MAAGNDQIAPAGVKGTHTSDPETVTIKPGDRRTTEPVPEPYRPVIPTRGNQITAAGVKGTHTSDPETVGF